MLLMVKNYLASAKFTSFLFFRAEASCSKLAELNPYVEVRVFTKSLDENLDFLKEFQVSHSLV